MRPHLLILHPMCVSGKPRNVTITEENSTGVRFCSMLVMLHSTQSLMFQFVYQACYCWLTALGVSDIQETSCGGAGI